MVVIIMALPWDERGGDQSPFNKFIIMDSNGSLIESTDDEKHVMRRVIQLTVREGRSVEVYERTGFSKWYR